MARPILLPFLRRIEINGSYLASTGSQTITLPTINVSPFYYATLILRVHEATWSGGASFKIDGYPSFPTNEDAREFVATGSAFNAEVTSAAALPAVDDATLSNLAPAYKFVAKLTQGSSSGAALFVVVSADLLLRPA